MRVNYIGFKNLFGGHSDGEHISAALPVRMLSSELLDYTICVAAGVITMERESITATPKDKKETTDDGSYFRGFLFQINMVG